MEEIITLHDACRGLDFSGWLPFSVWAVYQLGYSLGEGQVLGERRTLSSFFLTPYI